MRQNLKTSPQDIQYVDACENFQIKVSCLLTERSVRRSKNQALDHRMDVRSPCTRAMSSRGNHQREYKLVRTSDTPGYHTLVPYSRAAIPTEQTRVGSLLTSHCHPVQTLALILIPEPNPIAAPKLTPRPAITLNRLPPHCPPSGISSATVRRCT